MIYPIKKKILSVLTLLLISITSETFGQDPFSIHVVPSAITAVPAIHSGAFAMRQGKWIFIGGRRDGMHQLQANQAFDYGYRNDSIYIVDPASNTYKGTHIYTLPVYLYCALISSNMQYYQDGNYLYMIGGYGHEDSSFVWTTFPSLISVDLDCLISAINTNTSITGCFRQLIDSNFAVAGGGLGKIDSTYYLVMGHRFEGRYSKPATALFTQHYTEDIRKFNIVDNGVSLSIANYTAMKDTDVYHRRDFNLVPQIYQNGDTGMTVFGGVFMKNVDLPFLTPVDISASGVQHHTAFNENLNQYTTAVLPLYDSAHNYMHTVFFGGISLYTLDTVTMNLVQDTLVPFVSTISKVTRDSSGAYSESKFPESMPSLKGTNAYFIPDSLVKISAGIVDLNSISGNQLVGYIAGGIHSDFANVADLDPFGMSRPNRQLYEVYVDKTINSVKELEVKNAINNLTAFPNPASDHLFVNFSLNKDEVCEIDLYDNNSSLINTFLKDKKLKGDQHFNFDLTHIKAGVYNLKVSAGKSVKIVRVVKE